MNIKNLLKMVEYGLLQKAGIPVTPEQLGLKSPFHTSKKVVPNNPFSRFLIQSGQPVPIVIQPNYPTPYNRTIGLTQPTETLE